MQIENSSLNQVNQLRLSGTRTLYCTLMYCTVEYCNVLYCMVLYCIVPYRTALYCTIQYCTVPYRTVLYKIVQCKNPVKMLKTIAKTVISTPQLASNLQNKTFQKVQKAKMPRTDSSYNWPDYYQEVILTPIKID